MSDVVVLSKTQEIVVDASAVEYVLVGGSQTVVLPVPSTAVSVINAGPPGPRGIEGPAGPSNPTMNFVQAVASTEWIINHNFGFYPSISIFTVGGLEMMGEVVNTTDNQVRIRFNTSVAGSARLS